VIQNDVNSMKGVAFIGMLEAVRRDCGQDAGDRALALLDPELQDLMRRGLLTKSGWYPVTWYRELLAALQKGSGRGVGVIRQASRAAVVHDLHSGIYKVVVKVLSPAWLIRMTPQVFHSYYRYGDCEVSLSSSGAHAGTVAFEHCPGFDAAMWEDLIGGCLGMLEAAGAKNAKEAGREGGRTDDSSMIVDLRWEA
jgi:hypothetical protein